MRRHEPEILAAIIAKGETYATVTAALGWSLHTFNKKMQKKRTWQPGEYDRLRAYLGLKGGPIPDLNAKIQNAKGDQDHDQS